MILGNIVKLDNTHDLLSLRHKKYSAVNKCRIVFENKEPPVFGWFFILVFLEYIDLIII